MIRPVTWRDKRDSKTWSGRITLLMPMMSRTTRTARFQLMIRLMKSLQGVRRSMRYSLKWTKKGTRLITGIRECKRLSSTPSRSIRGRVYKTTLFLILQTSTTAWFRNGRFQSGSEQRRRTQTSSFKNLVWGSAKESKWTTMRSSLRVNGSR